MVTWQFKNAISPLSQGLWTPNLADWWLKRGEPTHKATWHIDIVVMWHIIHVVTWQIKNLLSPHSQGPWPPKLGRVLTQDIWRPTKKVTWHFNCVVRWKIKNVIFPQPQRRRDVKGKLALPKNKHKNAK